MFILVLENEVDTPPIRSRASDKMPSNKDQSDPYGKGRLWFCDVMTLWRSGLKPKNRHAKLNVPQPGIAVASSQIPI